MSVKIEGVPDGYELVRIGQPKKGEAFILACSDDIGHATNDFYSGGHAIVRKIEPPKPIEPPEGYRLLHRDEHVIDGDLGIDIQQYQWRAASGKEIDCSAGYRMDHYGVIAFARKIKPKTRPMTRDEFMAAWKQRGFCPVVSTEGDAYAVLQVASPASTSKYIVRLDALGWAAGIDIMRMRFASDNSPLTVEE